MQHVRIRAIKAIPNILTQIEINSDLFGRETCNHHRMLADKYNPMAAPSIVPKPIYEICASWRCAEFRWNPKLESTDSSPSTCISISLIGRPWYFLRFGASCILQHPSEASTPRRRRENCNWHAKSYLIPIHNIYRNRIWQDMFGIKKAW